MGFFNDPDKWWVDRDNPPDWTDAAAVISLIVLPGLAFLLWVLVESR